MTFISDIGCTLQILAMSLRIYESQKVRQQTIIF